MYSSCWGCVAILAARTFTDVGDWLASNCAVLLLSAAAAEFAEAFSSTVDKCHRLTHRNDIVPAVPASPL
jgi:hypothetical protein